MSTAIGNSSNRCQSKAGIHPGSVIPKKEEKK
jgi:hypothetical protein